MSNIIVPDEPSALDITIKGSIGEFSVASSDRRKHQSVPVKYIQTHVGLAVGGGQSEKLLQKLVPVREMFELKDLRFNEIMQRDIDDSRVSNDLIPYVLEEGKSGLVKLFPPIVAVVLPNTSDDRPAPYYDPVVTMPDEQIGGHKWHVERSGEIGSEVFEFKQLVTAGSLPSPHDYASLRLNSDRCKLVIVDGQHRAMALLALYRNIKKWPDKGRQVEPYYRRWTKSEIDKFDLSRVQLPVLICTFPVLDGRDSALPNVAEACRAVFLALNKNAKPVSDSRNHLLDDRDLIAEFLRCTLSLVKDKDALDSSGLRLWNIELDAAEDRVSISSPVAISGVMHLYYLIERLMLGSRGSGILVKKENFGKKTRLDDVVHRLGLNEQFSSDFLDVARRETLEPQNKKKLSGQFASLHGQIIVRGLDTFAPYRAHNVAAFGVEVKLRHDPKGSTYHALLFEGQGRERVFRSYIEEMRDHLKEGYLTPPPELQQVLEEFQAREKGLAELSREFYRKRTEEYLRQAPGWAKRSEAIHDAVWKVLFPQNFTTSAMQSALFLTFFGVVEAVNDKRGLPPEDAPALSSEEVSSLFDEYMDAINRFFLPTGPQGLERLVRVFIGNYSSKRDPSSGERLVAIAHSTKCLRKILVPGELKPDEWVKFRLIFLELWRSKFPEVSKIVSEERAVGRLQAVRAFYRREYNAFVQEHGLQQEEVSDEQAAKLRSECAQTVSAALGELEATVNQEELLGALDPEQAPSGGSKL